MDLGQFFAGPLIYPTVRKGFFGGRYVSTLSIINAKVYTFQKGALLGFARKEQYDLLCTLIAEPGGESSVAEFCRKISKEQWDKCGDNSKSLYDYVISHDHPNFDMSDKKMLIDMSKCENRLGTVLHHFPISVARGIGFGATRPDDFRAMWQRSYEEIDNELWFKAVQSGLNIPATPEPLPLEEAMQAVLDETTQYVREYFPHLVSSLNL